MLHPSVALPLNQVDFEKKESHFHLLYDFMYYVSLKCSSVVELNVCNVNASQCVMYIHKTTK